jgi:hypothetical protein
MGSLPEKGENKNILKKTLVFTLGSPSEKGEKKKKKNRFRTSVSGPGRTDRQTTELIKRI